MASLYEINHTLANKMAQLGEMLENGETPSQPILDELLDLKGDLTNKLVNYGKFIKNSQADIDGLDSEIKRLTAKKRALQNHTDLLKSNMLMAMQENNIERIDDPIMPIRIQNNGKASVIVANVESLPPEYQLIKIEANKTALEKAIKGGASFDGVRVEKGKHIRIG